MKKIAVYSIVLWFVLFVLTLIIVRPAENGNASDEEPSDAVAAAAIVTQKPKTTKSEKATSVSDSERTISVKIDDKITELRMDKYLEGVVAAEMPASFPIEALKAQAVAARTFAIRREAEKQTGGKKGHDGAAICSDPSCCMAYIDLSANAVEVFGNNAVSYKEKIAEAIKSTDGIFMTYDGVPILAAFHSIAGDRTEAAVDVWGHDVPYLVSVKSEGEENAAMYYGEVSVRADAFRKAFHDKFPEAIFSDDPLNWFKNALRGDGGGIKTVSVGGVSVSGSTIRKMFSLNSSDFKVAVRTNDSGEVVLVFNTIGYGHGVGMSQYGALHMAESGSTYDEILAKYYTGITIE